MLGHAHGEISVWSLRRDGNSRGGAAGAAAEASATPRASLRLRAVLVGVHRAAVTAVRVVPGGRELVAGDAVSSQLTDVGTGGMVEVESPSVWC